MNYRFLNNAFGWLAFVIASITYLLTVEETASYWDCGEFIAAAYKLEVPHPPGAPFFLLLGRMFSFLAFGNVEKVAYMVNLVSVFSSSFTILFLFWSITMLARKMLLKNGEEPNNAQIVTILGAGFIGAMVYTFSDTFWFSAVEAEVYAMSSFFTAVVFWVILKWELIEDERMANKWLILMAFLVGLSIGVHLLNLVAIPALALAYYYKKYTPTFKGGVISLLIGLVAVGIINNLIIPGLPTWAGKFEIFFVNSLGMPFGTGIVIFILLFFGLIIYGLLYSIKKQKEKLNTAILCLIFILIGYSSYMIIPIRSSYNPPIDENNPEDIMGFVSYLKREQYGERPLLYGPTIRAKVIDQKKTEPKYRKEGDKYVIYDYKIENVYDPEHMVLFPRIYSQQPNHIELYSNWVNIGKNRKITLIDNINFFLRYQIGHMYVRYFMWNYAGREHDVQDAGWLAPFDSTPNSELPHFIAKSKARNQFYMLPFVLGVLGLFFHYKKNKHDAIIVGLLFLFTGMALSIYLNSPPVEPRERDYIFVGSFYAFAIWIGIGVLAIFDLSAKLIKNQTIRAYLVTAISLFVPVIMLANGYDDHDRSGRRNSVDSARNLLDSCAPNAILFTGGDNDTFPVWYVQEVEGYRTDVRICNLSLLNTDWYIDLMKQRAYDSKELPITYEHNEYIQGTNDYVPYMENPKVKGAMDVAQFTKLVREKHSAIQVPIQGGGTISTFPTKTFNIPVNKSKIKDGVIPAGFENKVVDNITWKFKRRNIEKKHLIMLDMLANIAANGWERPFYFSSTVGNSDFLGLEEYFQLEGLAYRVIPVKNPNKQGRVQSDIMYKNMVEKFHWNKLNDTTRFYNENYKRLPTNSRDKYHLLAEQLFREGDKEKAKKVLDYSEKVIPDGSVPYDYTVAKYIDLYLKLGEKEKALKMVDIMINRCDRTLNYYQNPDRNNEMATQTSLYILNQMMVTLQRAKEEEKALKVQEVFSKYYKG